MLGQLKRLLFGGQDSGESFLIADSYKMTFCLAGRKHLAMGDDASVSLLLSSLATKPRSVEVYAFAGHRPGAEWFSWARSGGWRQVSLKTLSVESHIISLRDLGYSKKSVTTVWSRSINLQEDDRPW